MFNKKWLLLILVLIIVLFYRLLTGKLISEPTIIGVVIFSPFLYWWVVPYLIGEDMIIPTAATSLKAGESRYLRLAFFLMGITLIIVCAQMN